MVLESEAVGTDYDVKLIGFAWKKLLWKETRASQSEGTG